MIRLWLVVAVFAVSMVAADYQWPIPPQAEAAPRCTDANKVLALADGPCNTRRTCCNQRGECYCC